MLLYLISSLFTFIFQEAILITLSNLQPKLAQVFNNAQNEFNSDSVESNHDDDDANDDDDDGDNSDNLTKNNDSENE